MSELRRQMMMQAQAQQMPTPPLSGMLSRRSRNTYQEIADARERLKAAFSMCYWSAEAAVQLDEFRRQRAGNDPVTNELLANKVLLFDSLSNVIISSIA